MREIDYRSIRVLTDLQACQTQTSAKRGVGRYSKALFQEMVAVGAPREFYAFAANHHKFPLELERFPESRVVRVPEPPRWEVARDFEGGERDSLDAFMYSSAAMMVQPDVLHVSHVFEGLDERVPLPSIAGRSAAQVLSATLYDLIPLRFQSHYFRDERFARWYRHRLKWLHQTDLLLAISEATRQDAVELLGLNPDRIVTIHGGISGHFRPVKEPIIAREHLRKRYRIDRSRFVLYAAGDEFRKNLNCAISAYSKLPEQLRCNMQLVIVCTLGNERKAAILKVAQDAGLASGDMLLLGFVPEDDLVTLYSCCALFFFPSLYEGLGLPILEAMACGAPVIGGDNSSIREVIARKDALFNSSDPTSIAQTMHSALNDETFSNDLRRYGLERAKAFTWQNSANRAIAAFDDVLKRKRADGVRSVSSGWIPRYRIAILTPLPPCRSGIADYNARFLPFLAEYLDIDLYVDGYRVSDPMLTSAFRIFDVSSFRQNARNYDTILYELGNSEFHAHMLSLLEEFPGVVTLHDAYLSGLIAHLEFDLGERGRFQREMIDSHGPLMRRSVNLAKANNEDPIGAAAVQLPCTRRVFHRAIGVVSHSPFNLKIARQFYPEGLPAPYRIIPQMVVAPGPLSDEKTQKTRNELGYHSEDLLIVTFGHVVWTKWGDRLLDAFLESDLARNERCYLIFAGELAPDDFGRRLSERIQQSGLKARIKVTGFLSEIDYERHLRAATIAVQLRTKSRGGTPKAVLDCLAHGIPVILNNDASYKDYPDDVVMKLPPDPSTGEIAEALIALIGNGEQRQEFAGRGLSYVRQQHDPARCAANYACAIHEFLQLNNGVRASNYAMRLAPHLSACPDRRKASQMAADFLDARATPSVARPRLVIDVSHIAQFDHQTGIQRVVREMVRAAYHSDRPGFDPEAVVRVDDHLVTAHEWLGHQNILLPDERGKGSTLELRRGDHLLMLDSSWSEYGLFKPIFEKARQAKVGIVTAVYDLLPLNLPPGNFVPGGKEWFDAWFRNAVSESDGLLCISKAVADDVIAYIACHGIGHPGLGVGYFHLGLSLPVAGGCPDSSAVRRCAIHPYFLMVGTIEPRKNHALALDIFERLWVRGFPASLVIVGKPGWMVEEFLDRCRKHHRADLQLFLFERLNDAELGYLYEHAAALLLLSKGEGFGLPLVEAAHYGTPIICSDIPVFNEVAGSHATYVDINKSADDLAEEVANWWDRRAEQAVFVSSNLRPKSWDDSVGALLDVVMEDKWYWKK